MVFKTYYLDITGSLPEGEIPRWLKPNPINILMVDFPPYFGTDLPQKIVTKLGDTAFLKCKVFNLGNNMVSCDISKLDNDISNRLAG